MLSYMTTLFQNPKGAKPAEGRGGGGGGGGGRRMISGIVKSEV